ncbi:MAG: OsmC family peroxiredoxin [Gammaproteobacteria bacterium]|nr:MAG: OsmC family peroxiredoxin [Gammaproteobacteria bacterium]
MKALPHAYRASTYGTPDTHLISTLENGCTLEVAAPRNFNGPGDTWTPEEMLLGAVANCLALTFKAIASAVHLEWLEIHCQSEGELDKVDHGIKFTRIDSHARLVIASLGDREKAETALLKTERNCFVSNSLGCDRFFTFEVVNGNSDYPL